MLPAPDTAHASHRIECVAWRSPHLSGRRVRWARIGWNCHRSLLAAHLQERILVLTNVGTGQTFPSTSKQDGSFSFVDLQVGATYTLLHGGCQASLSQEHTGLQAQMRMNRSASANMRSFGCGDIGTNHLCRQFSAWKFWIPRPVTWLMLFRAQLSKTCQSLRGNVEMSESMEISPSVLVFPRRADQAHPSMARVKLDTMDTLDGMTVMAATTNEGGGPVQPSLEAVQEVHTVLANAPAEFWRAAAITVVSKSGTNQLHGSVFEDYNGSFLNSRTYFSSAVPFRVYNNFGASVGGPILKEKLFYFADYEGSREAAQG